MKIYEANKFIDPSENINIFKADGRFGNEPHMHEFVEFVYISSGNGIQRINNVGYPVKKGSLVFINYNQIHDFSVESDMVYTNILLKPEFISNELLNSENALEIFALSIFDEFGGEFDNAVPVISFEGSEIIEVEQIIANMQTEFHEKEAGYKLALRGYMYVLFTKILRKMKEPSKRRVLSDINSFAPMLLSYIENNLTEKITLGELAAKCFYSPSYFSKVFKECYGKSLTAYIRELRMAKAAELLKSTSDAVDSIIEKTGYGDKKLFYKHFREVYGTTPSAFRHLSLK